VDAAVLPHRRSSDAVVPQAATTRPDGPTGYLLAMGVLVLDAPTCGASYCKIARLIGGALPPGVNKGGESTLLWLLAIIGLSWSSVWSGRRRCLRTGGGRFCGCKGTGKYSWQGAESSWNRRVSNLLQVMVIQLELLSSVVRMPFGACGCQRPLRTGRRGRIATSN